MSDDTRLTVRAALFLAATLAAFIAAVHAFPEAWRIVASLVGGWTVGRWAGNLAIWLAE